MILFVRHEGEEFGPLSREEVFALLQQGKLVEDDPAHTLEDQDWKSLKEFLKGKQAGLFSVDQIVSLQETIKPSTVSPVASRVRVTSRPVESEPVHWEIPRPIVIAAVCLLVLIWVVAGSIDGFWRDHAPSRANAVVAQFNRMKGTDGTNSIGKIAGKPQDNAPVEAPAIQQGGSAPEKANPTVQQPLPSKSSGKILQATCNPTPAPKAIVEASAPIQSYANPPAATDKPQLVSVHAGVVAHAPQLVPDAPAPVANPPPKAVFAGDFFSIQSVKYIGDEPKDGCGVWTIKAQKPPVRTVSEFQPCLEVKVSARENTRSDHVMAKAYFFNQDNKLIASQSKPSKFGTKSSRAQFEMPVLFFKEKPDRFFFEVPEAVRNRQWKAVVVFGDKDEAKSACYPANERDFLLDYPEKTLVYDHSVKKTERKPAMDPLIEEIVKTKNPKMPQFTLFLRPPKGISDPAEVRGVLAICVLAGSIDDIKRELQKEEMSGDYNGLFNFANKHKLAILAWGSHTLWNPNMNHEDLARAQAKAMDNSFDTVAEAWERGVKELCEKYGLPDHDFLLWGSCGSAQWAHRLCLRKPDYFLAIDIHLPGSFDKPTPQANKVLWCLTTGELYGGYQRSLRFVGECRKLGYPMVYKAVVGLGHSGSGIATDLGFNFFEFALTLKESRDAYDQKIADAFYKSPARMSDPSQPAKPVQPWPEIFQHPSYYGDMVNQELFPADQVDMIPQGFRIALPTKELADAWNH